MRVIISAGGTGGHIYPALAIMNKIKEAEPNSEFLYIGTHNRMEKDIIPAMGINYKALEVYGFNRHNFWSNFKTLKCFNRATKECKKIYEDFKPDVVIGVGGYVTGPVIYEAHKMGIKTFIHEQNSVPGMSNKFLSKYADMIFVSFVSSLEYFPKGKTVYTGNPCSEEAIKMEPCDKKEFGLDDHKKLVLIVMGSLGATHVNDYLIEHLKDFSDKKYQLLVVTGEQDYKRFKDIKYPNIKIVDYIDKLPRVMKKTDLFISRAGASTLSEIEVLGVPSILIPSPYVPNNHQYKNAIDLVKDDEAILLEEKNLTGDVLVKAVDGLINDSDRLKEISNNLIKTSVHNSSDIIYDLIKRVQNGTK
jgi:UDP-N-acetylglucosamine--N-acetylmuramyl-(pentapeptide) pyrophosphoryl-undecaprenol N-acetylglucosamine transferase